MSKIYQEELSRIMQQQQQRAHLPATSPPKLGDLSSPANPGALPALFPGLGGFFGGRGGPQGAELQRAMDLYHQELGRLQQSALAAALRAQQQNGKDEEKSGKDIKVNGGEEARTSQSPTSLAGSW